MPTRCHQGFLQRLCPCERCCRMQGTMAVAHAHGVVHADLKPENILLREAVEEGSIECPQVVITDFGSAFSTSETDTARVALEMQTLPYRAPEVLIPLRTPS